MKNALRDHGILTAIRSLSAQGASGRLQVSTGRTDGALFFDRGELVDARLANLSGFQAINAVASVPDATYSFDPTIPPPAQSSISANERVLLKDFFGIEAVNPEQSRLIPEDDDEVTLVRPPVITESAVAEPVIAEPVFAQPTFTEPRPPLPERSPARPAFRPAFLFVLAIALIAVAAIALVYRFSKPDSSVPIASTSQTPTAADVPQAPGSEITSTVPNLTGNWKVVNTVEQTSYQPYKNMQVGFNVSINQTGKDFTGQGEKISENGRSLPANSRTPIIVKGTIDGDKVEATFSESGALRKTNGRFVWRIDKTSGGLTGTFVSTAARTSGTSAATKGS